MKQTPPSPDRPPKRPREDIAHGVLLVDKPGGMTSHDVVSRIRRRFHLKKVGHGGTLDPMATGLLPILLGRGTKLSQTVMSSDKTYEGVFTLGIRTDTQDTEGEIIARRDPSGITREQVEREMKAMVGDRMQTPPMMSAIKKDGVPLYKLARKGQTVERKARLIHLYAFTLKDYDPPRVHFRLRCTKGTYVRTLCDEAGEALGVGATLTELSRTRTGSFRLSDAVPLDSLLDMTPDALAGRVIPVSSISTSPTPHEHPAHP